MEIVFDGRDPLLEVVDEEVLQFARKLDAGRACIG
jgi:hypothetical protein